MKDHIRCPWCGDDPLYVDYHDQEWGQPVRNDQTMFGILLLETFQAGLSWITILRKRENFRAAFYQFEVQKVADMSDDDLHLLLQDAGIVRHKLKIWAARSNAQAFLKVAEEFGSFHSYLWKFTNNRIIVNRWRSMEEVPATTELSDRVSKDLKRRGFKFLGSTVVYAHLQACGIVDDHLMYCWKKKEF
jgi:DNA-3-methyladenine glycosylase I